MHNIIVRDLTPNDLCAVQTIHDGSFEFPDLSKLLYVSRKVIEANGKIVAAGFCRLTSEGILIVDESESRILRARAIAALISEMIQETMEMGMDECHVFVQQLSTGILLEKLGFVHCLGVPMVVTYG